MEGNLIRFWEGLNLASGLVVGGVVEGFRSR